MRSLVPRAERRSVTSSRTAERIARSAALGSGPPIIVPAPVKRRSRTRSGSSSGVVVMPGLG